MQVSGLAPDLSQRNPGGGGGIVTESPHPGESRGSCGPGPLAQGVRVGHVTRFCDTPFPPLRKKTPVPLRERYLSSAFLAASWAWFLPLTSVCPKKPYLDSVAWLWSATVQFRAAILSLACPYVHPVCGLPCCSCSPSLLGPRGLSLGGLERVT